MKHAKQCCEDTRKLGVYTGADHPHVAYCRTHGNTWPVSTEAATRIIDADVDRGATA